MNFLETPGKIERVGMSDCMAKPPALSIYVTILYFLGLEAVL
jgi:hypothetical protein